MNRALEPCWGTAGEIEMIRATRGDLDAWARCRPRLDESAALASRLGPAVFPHLPADDPARDVIKGTYRRAFYARRLLLRKAAEAIDVLDAEGIETMLLKGAALGDHTTRVMADVDVLVRPQRHEAAMRALQDAGWRAEPAGGPLWHDGLLRSDDELDLDLHAYALKESVVDDDLWEAAEPYELLGRETLVPCPTDQLLIICVHGLRYNPGQGPSWASDALVLLGARVPDWSRLVAAARRRRLTVAMTAALVYLAEQYDAPVPDAVLSDLRSAPVSRRERLAHRAAIRPPTYLRLVTLMWDRWRRVGAAAAPGSPRPGFARFLADAWGFERRRDLARRAAIKLTERNYR